MGDKTFSDRVRDQASNFSKIYDEFSKDYQKKSDLEHRFSMLGIRSQFSDPWRYLFEASIPPINNPPSPQSTPSDDEASGLTLGPESPLVALLMAPALKKAVLETAKRLRIAEARLGAIETNDPRIGNAVELGLLTYDDLEPLYRMSRAEQLSRGKYYVTRFSVDGSDPFVWRTLLEILCRTFLAKPGAKDEWTAKMTVQLGFDLIDIARDLRKAGIKFSNDKAHKELNKARSPYKSKYPAGVARDRIAELVKRIGPINQKAYSRLKSILEDEFAEGFDYQYLRKKPKSLKEIEEILQHAGKLFG